MYEYYFLLTWHLVYDRYGRWPMGWSISADIYRSILEQPRHIGIGHTLVGLLHRLFALRPLDEHEQVAMLTQFKPSVGQLVCNRPRLHNPGVPKVYRFDRSRSFAPFPMSNL